MNLLLSKEQMMEEVAQKYSQTFHSKTGAESRLMITPRIEGKKAIFKMELTFYHLDLLKNQKEDDDFMAYINKKMTDIIQSIKNDVNYWQSFHTDEINYLDFE